MFLNSLDRDHILNELYALKPDLAIRYDVNKIGIFGSVARNDASDYSDIDTVVDMQPNILKRFSLKAELEERFGRKVDVVRYWHGINKYLKARIDADSIYV